MHLKEAISGRRSVREYESTPVDENSIRSLIAFATAAPNAINEQPWTFAVVRDQGVLDRVSRQAKAHVLETTPRGAEFDRFLHILNDPSFQIFYHAPVLILISGKAPGPWIVEDCSLAAENLMLAALDAGLGSCWIGFAQSYLNTPEGKAALGLPAAWVPIAPIVVGHPKAMPAAEPRKDAEIRWVS